ncbi:urea carboxylase-associated family protein [Marinomonas sp.]
MSKVEAAYRAGAGSKLEINESFYNALKEGKTKRTLVETVKVPMRSGKAWEVPAGHIFRIRVSEGPQVGDFNMWNKHDPRERMWASRSRQLQRAHVSTHDRLWSTLPFLRPMVTIVDDSLADYGIDNEGGRVHDLLGTRCDPYVNNLLTGEDFDFHCHSNLVRAVLPYGLTEFDVHDVLNVFQCTGLNEEDKYFMKACPAKKGDYLEFFAEIDLLCAMSCCPGGDLSVDLWGPNAQDPLSTCHPLEVEIYKLESAALEGWEQPKRAAYAGNHGLSSPAVNWEEEKAKLIRCD